RRTIVTKSPCHRCRPPGNRGSPAKVRPAVGRLPVSLEARAGSPAHELSSRPGSAPRTRSGVRPSPLWQPTQVSAVLHGHRLESDLDSSRSDGGDLDGHEPVNTWHWLSWESAPARHSPAIPGADVLLACSAGLRWFRDRSNPYALARDHGLRGRRRR